MSFTQCTLQGRLKGPWIWFPSKEIWKHVDGYIFPIWSSMMLTQMCSILRKQSFKIFLVDSDLISNTQYCHISYISTSQVPDYRIKLSQHWQAHGFLTCFTKTWTKEQSKHIINGTVLLSLSRSEVSIKQLFYTQNTMNVSGRQLNSNDKNQQPLNSDRLNRQVQAFSQIFTKWI